MIREFEEQDIGRVMEIWLQGNLDAHDFVPESYWKDQQEEVKEQMMRAEMFVYEKEGEILGFAGMQGTYLAGLFVDRDVRSRGIGGELLEYMKHSYQYFFFYAYVKNTRALAFYEAHGLKRMNESENDETGEMECAFSWGR